MNDHAAFRTAAIICVLLCLIWDLATPVLIVVLPVQLVAIGLLYWGADGLVSPGNHGSAHRPGQGPRGQDQGRRREDAATGGR